MNEALTHTNTLAYLGNLFTQIHPHTHTYTYRHTAAASSPFWSSFS